MKVLVACEESQEVCKAFRALGHEAYSCDLLPCSGGHPEWHIQGDVRKVLFKGDWDLVIAHPPCTRLCNSGVSWLEKRNLWTEMYEACSFFNLFKSWYQVNPAERKLAIENPIPHKYAKEIIGNYSQIIQPWQFGHGEMKATCLWLYGLSPLASTDVVEGREQRLHRLPPSSERARLRSKTYPGIAKAMANQWSEFQLQKQTA